MGWLLYLAAMPAALVMLMRALSLVLPKGLAQLVHYYAFLITAFFLMMSCAAYGVVVGCVLRVVGYGGLIQWTVARAAKWSMWAITGTTFRVTGSVQRNGGVSGEDALKERPVVFVGNHQTCVSKPRCLWISPSGIAFFYRICVVLTRPLENSTSLCWVACSPNTPPSPRRSR